MILLEHHLKSLRLPTFLKYYQNVAEQCREKGADYGDYLSQLSEMEVSNRHNRAVLSSKGLKKLDSLPLKHWIALTLMRYPL